MAPTRILKRFFGIFLIVARARGTKLNSLRLAYEKMPNILASALFQTSRVFSLPQKRVSLIFHT